eukprot:CAMPEP_0119325442 /NCGR_PEP_ID=MMETSP1333-20130426/65823_1 /TAXON_ID=418940 /ORGANISM="Scyphosphaera apsteinii, Strain RCC1455" /LENGTH=187 /DNA_ID=CAMNT_0007333427 /DNA_START=16 /DNA_END=575 /DNA_ORIENTATION=+
MAGLSRRVELELLSDEIRQLEQRCAAVEHSRAEMAAALDTANEARCALRRYCTERVSDLEAQLSMAELCAQTREEERRSEEEMNRDQRKEEVCADQLPKFRTDDMALSSMSVPELRTLEAHLSESLTKVQHYLERESDERRLCIICMEREKEIVFIPCAHFITCSRCAERCTRCPKCRDEIDSRIQT